jgi:hypothetical protein
MNDDYDVPACEAFTKAVLDFAGARANSDPLITQTAYLIALMDVLAHSLADVRHPKERAGWFREVTHILPRRVGQIILMKQSPPPLLQ